MTWHARPQQSAIDVAASILAVLNGPNHRLIPVPHPQIQFHRTPLAGLDAMTAATDCTFPRHTHDQYGVGVIDAGGHVSLSGRGQVQAGPGSVISVNPGEVHDGRPVRGQPRTWRILYLDPALMNGLRVEIAEGDRAPLELHAPAFNDALTRTLFDALFAAATGVAGPHARSACETLLVRLADRLSSLAGQPVAPSSTATPNIRSVLGLIDADPACSALSLERLAREAGITRYQLVRAFARECGLTPHAYILQRRLSLARRLMRTHASLAEIAVRAGFFDQSHLTHYFVRQFGISPARYASAKRG